MGLDLGQNHSQNMVQMNSTMEMLAPKMGVEAAQNAAENQLYMGMGLREPNGQDVTLAQVNSASMPFGQQQETGLEVS